EEDVFRRVADLGVLAADDAAEADRLVSVSDDAGVAVELAHFAVEAAHRLAVSAGADDDRLPSDLREVVRMERMAERHHHVVGDVDDVVDRTEADRLEPALDALRRRLDGHAADDVAAEARAHLPR